MYNPDKIFLMGVSWGGTLRTFYLLNTNYQNKITGWIEVDRAHNRELGNQYSINYVKDYAYNQVASSDSSEKQKKYWRDALVWYDSVVELWVDNQMTHYQYVENANGIYHDPAKNSSINLGMEWMFFFPMNLLAIVNNNNILYSTKDLIIYKGMNLFNINLSSEMYKITLPVQLLWRRYDGIVPVQLADDAYNNLGTDDSNKHLYIFENSGHSPAEEEPDLFAEKVTEFINQYK